MVIHGHPPPMVFLSLTAFNLKSFLWSSSLNWVLLQNISGISSVLLCLHLLIGLSDLWTGLTALPHDSPMSSDHYCTNSILCHHWALILMECIRFTLRETFLSGSLS